MPTLWTAKKPTLPAKRMRWLAGAKMNLSGWEENSQPNIQSARCNSHDTDKARLLKKIYYFGVWTIAYGNRKNTCLPSPRESTLRVDCEVNARRVKYLLTWYLRYFYCPAIHWCLLIVQRILWHCAVPFVWITDGCLWSEANGSSSEILCWIKLKRLQHFGENLTLSCSMYVRFLAGWLSEYKLKSML